MQGSQKYGDTITLCILLAVTDLMKDVLLQGNGEGLARAWHAFLILMALMSWRLDREIFAKFL